MQAEGRRFRTPALFAERWGRQVRNDIAADQNVLGIKLSKRRRTSSSGCGESDFQATDSEKQSQQSEWLAAFVLLPREDVAECTAEAVEDKCHRQPSECP